MRLALAVASLVVLAVHGIVFYDQVFHPWQRHQTAYFERARTLARSARERAEMEARKPRIEQTIVTQFGGGRVDRCTTCHIASDDPRFEGHVQPLRTHPYSAALGDTFRDGRWERRHKFSDFGCTVCHDGQGRGLEQFHSHGEDPFWPEPLLGYVTQANWRADLKPKLAGKEYMQANCAQCHTEEDFPGTPLVKRGRELFFSTNCYGCHRIEGIADGSLGPDLTEAGKKFKLDYLWESIVEPRANMATSFMPKFKLSEGDVKALVIFMKSRRGMNLAETSLERYRARSAARQTFEEPAAQEQRAAALAPGFGRQLIQDRACTACHKLGEQDGGIAPDLSFEGLVRDEAWILEHFRNPRALVPDSIMPAFRFTDQEFRSIAAYLAGLKTPPPVRAPAETYRALCARCHGERGDGNGPAALYLDPAPRDLTKAAFMNSKPEQRLLQSIRDGIPGTSMPAWGSVLDDRQSRELLAYVFATFTGGRRGEPKQRNVPERNPVAMSAASVARGERIFLQRCGGCHGRKADGKGPNSLDILPRPRNLRNGPFLESVSDSRLFDSILYGVQGTAMPPWVDYGLSREDVGDLVNFMRNLNPKSGSRYATNESN